MSEGLPDRWVEVRPERVVWEQGDNRLLYKSREDGGGYTCVVAVEVVRNHQFLCRWIYVSYIYETYETHIYDIHGFSSSHVWM